MSDVSRPVREHYGRAGLFDAIIAALRHAGKDLERVTPDDLAPVDEFHTRGRAATVELANLLHLAGTEHVLDLGSGLGGPARFLARTYGCRVTGLDLTPEFVEVAQKLTRLTHLDTRVSFRQGDALATPFADACFDVVWSQNVAMNIRERGSLYAEVRRVLRPGGRYALSDVVSIDGALPHFPVPWARNPDASHLLSSAATRGALEAAGFRVLAWEDTTRAAASAAEERAQVVAPPAALGLHLVLGPAFKEISINILRNYREGRIGVIHGIVERAA